MLKKCSFNLENIHIFLVEKTYLNPQKDPIKVKWKYLCTCHPNLVIDLKFHPGEVFIKAQSGEIWKFYISFAYSLNNDSPDLPNWMVYFC